MDTKPQDALVILKLYELRSEALMRAARAWFFTEFNPHSGREIVALLQSGEKTERLLPHGGFTLGSSSGPC